MKVSSMLDRLYLAFDRIANKHRVFKVETIGGTYCVVLIARKRKTSHLTLILSHFVLTQMPIWE